MQFRLPIFNDKCFTDLLVEKRDNEIDIVASKKLKKSWRIEKKGSRFKLTVPNKLDNCSTEIRVALLRWAEILISNKFNKKGLNSELSLELSQCEKLIFKELTGYTKRVRNIESPDTLFRDSSGIKFDLHELFTKINSDCFDSTLVSYLRWGQYGSRTSYHTTFLDEDKREHHLITIAGIYNHPSVPSYAIESVMHHEMLHIFTPPIINSRRRTVHHREFRKLEREFKHHEKWQKWLRGPAQKIHGRLHR